MGGESTLDSVGVCRSLYLLSSGKGFRNADYFLKLLIVTPVTRLLSYPVILGRGRRPAVDNGTESLPCSGV